MEVEEVRPLQPRPASRRHTPRRLTNLSAAQWALVSSTEASSCWVYSSGTATDLGACFMLSDTSVSSWRAPKGDIKTP